MCKYNQISSQLVSNLRAIRAELDKDDKAHVGAYIQLYEPRVLDMLKGLFALLDEYDRGQHSPPDLGVEASERITTKDIFGGG